MGAIPPLVSLLGSSHSEIPSSAAWALSNITGDEPYFRDLVLQAGVVKPLLKLLEDHQSSDMKSVHTYVWTLQNLFGGSPKPDFTMTSCSLNVLNELIHHHDEEVVKDACWALNFLANGPNEHIQTVIDVLGNTGIRRIVELLNHSSKDVHASALQVVGNIVSGDEDQTQIVIDNGALPCLLTLLSSTSKNVWKQTFWAISNIAAGTVEQIQAVIDIGVYPKVLSLMKEGCLAMRKEAAWVVTNATQNGSPGQVKYLMKQ